MTFSKFLMTASLLATAAAASAFAPTFTTAPDQMTVKAAGWDYTALFTIGETAPNGFQPVGIMDGIGAYSLNATTVRAFVAHELRATSGKPYALSNGAALTGARITYFDIDKASKGIVDVGQAYGKIIDRAGAEVTASGAGIARLCSASLFEAGSFAGRGLADRMFMAGEEGTNGTQYALDPATNTLHAVPAMGRLAWENTALVDTGTANKVAFIIGDDRTGAPLWLYVGDKQPGGDFLERNGLAEGKLYAWKSNSNETGPSGFNEGNGATRSGSWVEVTVKDPAKAGMAGYDAAGYANTATLDAEAKSKGAMGFSRPEDVATNPVDGTLVAFASTGSGFEGGVDAWGTTYTVDIAFDANGNPSDGTLKIVYNGNLDATRALRSPDNLDWSGANTLLIQEDRSTDWASAKGVNAHESGLLEVDMDGNVTRILEMDRFGVPGGQTDSNPLDFGNWENSGIVDVSTLFGAATGTWFLGNVQAHSINLGGTDLVEGGQLFLLQAGVPEASTWAMLIAGFGVVGFAARRRRAAAAQA